MPYTNHIITKDMTTTKTVKECKEYLINKRGWKFKRHCKQMNWYHWSTKWSGFRIWTMKEMRDAVECMQRKDWMDAETEKLRQGIQQSLF